MGNKICCETEPNPDFGHVVVAPRSNHHAKIQQFLTSNPNLRKILQGNTYDQQSLKTQRNLFISNSQQYRFDDGIFYGLLQGEDKVRSGYGIMLYYDLSYYEGQWEDDMRNGKGVFASESGEFYNGYWKNDVVDGKGTFKSVSPFNEYEGEWEQGEKQGYGTETYQDGSKYTGSFVNGEKEGFGKLLYSDGTFYEGQFKENLFQGQGIYAGKTHRYEGGWSDGRMHGFGKSQWFSEDGKPLGNYIGEYSFGKKDGFGQYSDINGNFYKAVWINGEINEKGPIITSKQSLLH